MKSRGNPAGSKEGAAVRVRDDADAAGEEEPVAVLLVDDRADRLLALEAALADLPGGVAIVQASSGAEALRLLLKQDFAVVLLDVHMPGMDGFETASLIRGRSRSEHTPIIFITAMGPNETQVTRGYALGAVDYIFAPVMPEVLRAKVEVFIDLHRKTAQVRRQGEWLRAEAERRAERLETRLKGLLERLEVGVFRANAEGRILEANPAFLRLLGLPSAGAAAATPLGELLPGWEPSPAGEGEFRARDFRIGAAGNGERWISVSTSAAPESGGAEVLEGMVEDLTARKRAEEALRSAHEVLERQAKDLSRSNADLQRFAYVVSHDLQEPLRMISTFTGLLAKKKERRFDDEARQYIAYAQEGADRMQAMIHGLLEFCLLETVPGRSRPTDCNEALDKVAATLRLAIQESGAVLERDPLPVVAADDVQVSHVLQNLVANAVKFRRPGTEPRIRVGAERQGERWAISVRDDGIGIEPDSADSLFLLFKRLPGSEGVPGIGMGLAICKRIVERHGGRIWMEPTPGGGSTFRFTLPAAPGKEKAR
jgi:signal transduction histidine kinase